VSVPRRWRPLVVVLYAAFVGLLLASYVSPLHETQVDNTARERLIKELNTPAGIERAARERYGMIRPGEKVYIIPEADGERSP
jgi:cell division protein FtsB